MTHRVTSTYRLQLHAHFGFRDANDVLDYLDRLGISDVYTSPYFRAERGTTHGYNTIDHSKLNPALGSNEDYARWTDEIRARSMGHILDVVPNHMGIATGENEWWNDVLENGPSSLFADHFDILWRSRKPGLENKVLLPILGDQYGEVLERGDLRLRRLGGRFVVDYFDHALPVAPRSLIRLLEGAGSRHGLPEEDAHAQELASIITGLRHLPKADQVSLDKRSERGREKEVLKRRLEALCAQSEVIAQSVDSIVASTNGTAGDPQSFDGLDALLRDQNYRLAFWRVATEEINYRRFFDINQLAAIRMESPIVFEAAHRFLFQLIDEGRVTGLRLDHTDGLYEPAQYLRKLKRLAPDVSDSAGLYVVVEKVLESTEKLPPRWPVDGTTGYEFLNAVNLLWVQPASESAMTETYKRFTGNDSNFDGLAHRCKSEIMRAGLSSEINMLAQALEELAEESRRSRDFTLASLTKAIIETIACFPVYRTYMRTDGSHERSDEPNLQRATRLAKRGRGQTSESIFDFLRDVLMLKFLPFTREGMKEKQIQFVMRFQQVSGAVMAKGVEDTAFYRFYRLISLNEVGCNPATFGSSVDAFHAHNAERFRLFPRSMTTTSTHDTKRGADARARLSVLSEVPELWEKRVAEWSQIASRYRTEVDERAAPSANDEYLFYQATFGHFPFATDQDARSQFVARLTEYMEKAVKEAKDHSSWLNPNQPYEDAMARFVRGMLSDADFIRSMEALVEELAPFGIVNGLGQLLLKLAGPGIPDTYQGEELWEFAFVDPDNRKPVDFDLRRQMLARIEAAGSDPLPLAVHTLSNFKDGLIKMMVLRTVLRLRRETPELFIEGEYAPIEGGPNVVAFSRHWGEKAVVCVVPRLTTKLAKGPRPLSSSWGDAEIAFPRFGKYRNAFTGVCIDAKPSVKLADVFREWPVALLELL